MAFRLTKIYLLTIAIISASALAYEVLLLRLFSVIQWHHFAFMVISLALLGYGVSGVFLALLQRLLSQHFSTTILINLLLLAVAMPGCFIVAQALPFNPAELLWDPMQMLYWSAVYLVLALPFFFAANIIGLSFYQFTSNITTVYAADLVGAALGSIGIIALLFWLFNEQILLFLPAMILLTGLMVISFDLDYESPYPRRGWQVVFVLTLVFSAVFLPDSITVRPSPYKGLSQFMTIPQTAVMREKSSPLGVITVVESKTVPVRHAPGLSIVSEANLPEQLAVFSDGEAMSAINHFNGDIGSHTYLGQTTSSLPYQMQPLQDVLILGAGTGNDVLQALFFKAAHIDAVEQNPQIIQLLQQDFRDFSGDIYRLPEVTVHQSEARAYMMATDKQYDLIKLSLMDGAGISSGGLYSMAENYLYTQEAIQAYLQHLKADGYLSMTRWAKLPPRDMPKLLATVINAMSQQGIANPSEQIVLIRSWQTVTLLVKNGVISMNEMERFKTFCQQNNFDLVYYPGIKASEINHFHRLKHAYLNQAASALLSTEYDAYLDNYKFNIAPATDDKPYFSQFFKWRTLPEILSLTRQGSVFLLENGYLLLVVALGQALLASLVFLLFPLWLWQRRRRARAGDSHQAHKKVMGYFFALGLAFLFIEIAFIQKFILILQHPVYAITTVLTSFLLAAGIGSYLSGKLTRFEPQTKVTATIVGLIVISSIYLLAFDAISNFLLQQQDWLRYSLAILLIMPLGCCMGVPFPTGLSAVGIRQAELIPWAWGINGFASVISPILATLIAMQFGFVVLVISAVLLYLVANWIFFRLDL